MKNKSSSPSTWRMLILLSACIVLLASNGPASDDATGSDRPLVGFWPGDYTTKSLHDPKGCIVTLIPTSDISRQLTHPCGEYFLPEFLDEEYLWWMERPGEMSPQFLSYFAAGGGREPESGRKLIAPLYPAGTVALGENEPDLAQGETFRVIQDTFGVTRRLSDPELAKQGVQVPEGLAVAAIADSGQGTDVIYKKLTRPLTVQPSKLVTAAPHPPSEQSSHLIVRLHASTPMNNLEMGISSADELIPPDFVGSTKSWVVGIWYDIPFHWVTFSATTDTASVDPREIVLARGGITFELLTLIPNPNLQVDYGLPDGLFHDPRIRVEDLLVSKQVVRDLPLESTQGSLRIPNLPISEYRVVLSAGGWEFPERVNLTNGRDEHVAIFPDYFEIRGTVTIGDEPGPADVGFYAEKSGRWYETSSDEDGEYRLVLFEPTSLAKARPTRSTDTGWILEPLSYLIEYDTEHNFLIPNNHITLVIEDDTNGKPIEGAWVKYTDLSRGEGSQSGRLETDDQGRASLPPVRYPPVEIEAGAQGFETESRSLHLAEDATEVEFRIRLKRSSSDRTISVVLPNGEPAQGASVFLLDSPANPPYWRSKCDENGTVGIPEVNSGFIAVTDSRAGFVVRHLPVGNQSVEPEVVKMPERGASLSVRVTDLAGYGIPKAHYSLRVDGLLLAYPLTYFLMPNSPPLADDSGLIYLDGLPLKNFEILAYGRPSMRQDVVSGGFNHFFTPISAPWPHNITVVAVE